MATVTNKLSKAPFPCDPAQCHAQIVALHERSGIGALRCVFNANGLLDNAEALAGMTLFAAEVLPTFRASP